MWGVKRNLCYARRVRGLRRQINSHLGGLVIREKKKDTCGEKKKTQNKKQHETN